MIRRGISLAMIVGALAQPGYAQDGIDTRFQAPALPAPSGYRTATGQPGGEYWQQRVDYAIEATLDPITHTLTGSETITYANNSPDTLRFVWLQLDQNLYSTGSKGAQVYPDDTRTGFQDEGGYAITSVVGEGAPLRTRIDDTLMRVELPSPLAPGGSTSLSIDWSFTVPVSGSQRMGRDGEHYLLAQWYPRLVVYDDVEGWNTMPYLGQGEFYLEYGDFTVALTLPGDYLVGATGSLENEEQVLTAAAQARLEEARSTGVVVQVVGEEDLEDPAQYLEVPGAMQTWRFRAENVRDFAWAASPEFVWDAAAYEDVLVHALYRPGASAWREAALMTLHSLEFYSGYLGAYPYPTATAVEGPVFGMEYPMIVFVAPEREREGLFDVLDHEWGHMWFPMIVGSDERRYAWMDEGFGTFINQLSKKVYLPGSQPELQNVAQYAAAIRAYEEQPIGSVPDAYDPDTPALGIGAYTKPAVMLNALRAIAGSQPFDAAFKRYYEVWSFKHPQPADFFRLMENELGMELGWFWHNWIYSTGSNDMAILGVDQNRSGDRWSVRVSIDQRGDLLMPARVVATTADGATDVVTIPVEAFYGSDRATATLALPARAERIAVNDGPEWGDIIPQNNVWDR